MFLSRLRGVRFLIWSLTLAGVALAQSPTQNVTRVLSNKEARKAAIFPQEATVPSGLNVTEFSVQVSVGADGDVEHVSNAYSLSDALFTAAAKAAREWRFRTDGDGGKRHGFVAEITFHGPVTGTVVAPDGKPAAGVKVFGSVWSCCPPQQDGVTTDQSGSFRIEHPGEVLHFVPSEGFQPQALVVAPEISPLRVTLAPISSSLSLSSCSEPERGFERVGWGKYGLQFDVPRTGVRLIRGKVDVDYVVHIVKAAHGDDRVEFWFGPYAMNPTPDDEQFIESVSFAIRNVIGSGNLSQGSQRGAIGSDTWGRLPDGNLWREAAFGLEGARYWDVSPQEAQIFDRVINSACWIPYPER